MSDNSEVKKKGTAQTRATSRYQAKNGLVSASFKLNAADVARFKNACKSVGVPQNRVLTNFIRDFSAAPDLYKDYTEPTPLTLKDVSL